MIVAISIVFVSMLTIPGNLLAGDFIGRHCFMGGLDLWEWNVEKVGNSYTVVGKGIYPSAMVGGGEIVGGTLYLTVTETEDNGRRAIHAIKLKTGTWTGTNDTSYHDPDGTNHVTFSDMEVHKVSCTAADAVEGQTND